MFTTGTQYLGSVTACIVLHQGVYVTVFRYTPLIKTNLTKTRHFFFFLNLCKAFLLAQVGQAHFVINFESNFLIYCNLLSINLLNIL